MGFRIEVCFRCHKFGSAAHPLGTCTRCRNETYCSPECQKLDWKMHKPNCGFNAPSLHKPKAAINNTMDEIATLLVKEKEMTEGCGQSLQPFTRIKDGIYFDGMSRAKVFLQLVDIYRMMVDEEKKFRERKRGIYAGNALQDFQLFLTKAEQNGRVLPGWWDEKARRECELDSRWRLTWSLDRTRVALEYQDPLMPRKFKILAELIEGSSVVD